MFKKHLPELKNCPNCKTGHGCAYGDKNDMWLIFCWKCDYTTELFDDKIAAAEEWNKTKLRNKKVI